MNFSLFCFPPPLGADYFLRTSFSVTIEAFLLRIRDVLWDGLKSELSNWTYRAKVPDYLAVRFTNNGGYSHNLSPKRERERERERGGGGGEREGRWKNFLGRAQHGFHEERSGDQSSPIGPKWGLKVNDYHLMRESH